VFITDEVKDIVPEFLMLLHGVIDSPDIPLNVSRSFLQADSNVKKINSYITRKVADKLNELFRRTGKPMKKNGKTSACLLSMARSPKKSFTRRRKILPAEQYKE
jgi:molecular chaperone HtpG